MGFNKLPYDATALLHALHGRVPGDGDGAPYEQLNWQRFIAVLDDDLRAIEAGRGGGRDWGTVLVAAADSHAGHNAHFTCDGANDEVEVQNAVNSLPNGMGQVVLLEGTYWFSSPVVLDSVVVAIRGMGPYASLIRTGAVAFDVIYATAWIANLGFRGVMGGGGWEGIGVRARDCSTTWVVDCGFSLLAKGIDTGFCGF